MLEQRSCADEHVLEILADNTELIDRPQEPLQPGLGLERRNRERPVLRGIEAEPHGYLSAGEP